MLKAGSCGIVSLMYEFYESTVVEDENEPIHLRLTSVPVTHGNSYSRARWRLA